MSATTKPEPVEVPTDEGTPTLFDGYRHDPFCASIRHSGFDTPAACNCWKSVIAAELDRVRAEVQATQLAGARESLRDMICDDVYADDTICDICDPLVGRIFASGVVVDADKVRADVLNQAAEPFDKLADKWVRIAAGYVQGEFQSDALRRAADFREDAAAIRSTGSGQ